MKPTNKQELKVHAVWMAMKQRCYNPNHPFYNRYGGRGIKICSRWLTSFENFTTDMGPRPAGHSLDRIDNNGNYEPSNCRWATMEQQNMNRGKRAASIITYNGQTMTISEWERYLNVTANFLRNRFRKGWPILEIFTIEKHKRRTSLSA